MYSLPPSFLLKDKKRLESLQLKRIKSLELRYQLNIIPAPPVWSERLLFPDSQLLQVPNLVIAGITSPLSKKYGKKELAVVGTFFSGILYFILYFLKIQNPWVFVILSSIGFIGVNFFNMIIWANITDVIDYQEVVTGKREDGIVYSVYSFARKVGLALAGGTTRYSKRTDIIKIVCI
mgnify:CR=1 FL=1